MADARAPLDGRHADEKGQHGGIFATSVGLEGLNGCGRHDAVVHGMAVLFRPRTGRITTLQTILN